MHCRQKWKDTFSKFERFQTTPILAFPHQGGRDFGLDQEYPFLSQRAVVAAEGSGGSRGRWWRQRAVVAAEGGGGGTASSFHLDGGRLGWG